MNENNKEAEYLDKAWMDALQNCPDDILEAEILRREEVRKRMETPKLIRDPSENAPLRTLRDLSQSYIDQLAEEPAYDDNKVVNYIFEAVIEYFFGKDVWIWVRKRLQ